MSEDVLKEIGFFAAVFAAVFCLWLLTGGPQRASSDKAIFLKPLPPEGSGEIYGSQPVQYRTLATTTVIVPGLKQ